MKNPEIGVILRIISEGSVRRAFSLGLDEKYFSDPNALLAWKRIIEFSSRQATLGETPSYAYLCDLVPTFPKNAETPERTLGELIEIVRTGALDRSLRALVDDMDRLLTEFRSPESALEHAVAEVKRLARVSSTLPSHLAMDIGEACSVLREEYDHKAAGGGLTGIPFPWEPLNRAIGGMAAGTFNVVYAPSKHGKTWMTLEMAAVAPFMNANARVLVISGEMPINQVYRRIIARLAQVDYGGVVTGTLGDIHRERYFATLRRLEQEQTDLDTASSVDIGDGGHRCIRVIRPSARTGAGIDSIRSAVEVFEPDILFVDAVYRLADAKGGRDYDWRGLQGNMAALKDMSGEYSIPVIVTAQANRKGWSSVEDVDFDEYGDISMNAGFIQEADVVVRLHRFTLPNGDSKVLFTMPAVRESATSAFITNFAPCTDFSLYLDDVTPESLRALVAGGVAEVGGDSPHMIDIDDEDEPPEFIKSTKGLFKP